MKISREVKIGAFGLMVVVLFIIALNFIKGKDILHRHRTFYAVFNATAGLQDASPVSVNGLGIGKVTDIRFLGNSSKILVEMTVYNPVFIPDNTAARIFSPDLLGTKNIELLLGNSTASAQSGDTLRSEIQISLSEEVNRQIAPVKLKAENLLSSLDTMVTVLQSVFNAETRHNLNESFVRIRSTLTNLESTSYNLDTLVYGQRKRMERILFNIESITGNLRANEQNISRVITNFSAISDTIAKANLSKTINNLNRVLADVSVVTEKISGGHGSVGLLLNDEHLYQNLEKSTNELNALVKDMKLNPQRYLNFSLFPPGRKQMQYNPEPAQ